MLLKIFVALLAVAYALPEADPQANTRRPCTTKISTVTSTIPATTKTRTVTRCTRRPKTTTVTSTATTCTRRPSTFTTTKTVTVTPTPSAVKPPAYLEVIIHPDALCGTKPVNQQFQNPNDDQITVAVPAGGSDCRNTIKTVSSFSFVKLNSGSFTSGCRLYCKQNNVWKAPGVSPKPSSLHVRKIY